MMQLLLVAIGAGAASALLFASVASGSLFATFLFYLAALPIIIASMGWTHLAGLLAALLAATGLGLVLGFYFFLAFLFGVGLPAWWLGYLALLGRNVATNGSAGGMEWYPIGRLVLWAAIIGSLVIVAAVLNFGTDKESFQNEIRSAFERALKTQGGQTPIPGRADTKQVIDILVAALPPAAAVLLTILNTFNLWLAARIVKVSGRLRRPWPDLATMTLPGVTPGILAVAIAASFLPDIAGLLSGVLAASLFMAYALMGFAVLHAITRGMGGRVFALIGTYFAVLVFGWPILAMSLLGLAETAFNIRARFAAPAAGPPTTRT
jgi:predicted membrane protein DUF2232